MRVRTAIVLVALLTAGSLSIVRQLTPGAIALEVHKVESKASFSVRPDAPFFVLLLGSDERAGLGGHRSDAIHVVGVNPASNQATIVNIPRDTYLAVPGRGMARINEAYDQGGAALAAQVIGGFVGVPIQFVLVTTFEGLKAMTDELGGVVVDVPYPMYERNSGADFPQGPVLMYGPQALAFSRNRHIPGGDFGRSEHQAVLMLATLAKLRAEGRSAPQTLRYLTVLLRHTRLDGVSVVELTRLARLALALDPANVRNVTMPGRTGAAGRASVVFATPPATALFADFADDAVLQAH